MAEPDVFTEGVNNTGCKSDVDAEPIRKLFAVDAYPVTFPDILAATVPVVKIFVEGLNDKPKPADNATPEPEVYAVNGI